MSEGDIPLRNLEPANASSNNQQALLTSPNRGGASPPKTPNVSTHHNWKPPAMRPWYHLFLLLWIIIFLALNEHFGRQATRNPETGFHRYHLLKQPYTERMTKTQSFCFFYLPNLIVFTFSQCFQSLDLDYKAIYPYILLARPNGALAKESIFTRYSLLNCYRDWDLLLQTLVTLVPSFVYPLLASSWIQRRLVPHGSADRVQSCGTFSYGPCIDGDILITTSTAMVGLTTFFLAAHGLLLAVFAWRCIKMTTGLSSSPHLLSGLATLARKETFRSEWIPFHPLASTETLEQALGNRKLRLHWQTDAESPYLEFTESVDSIPSSTGVPKRATSLWWRKEQPFLLRVNTVIVYSVLAWVWVGFLKTRVGDSSLSMEHKRLLCVFVALIIKSYLEAMEYDCRFLEALRSSWQARRKGREGNMSVLVDFISTPPLLGVWVFLKLRLLRIAAFASLPWIIEIWIVVHGTNPWAFAPRKEGKDNNLVDQSGRMKPPLWLMHTLTVMISLVWGFLYISLFDPASPIRFVLPRFPNVVAARLSYIHSSRGLTDASVKRPMRHGDNRSNPAPSGGNKYAVGWYDNGGQLQLRMDVDESCLKYYDSELTVPSINGLNASPDEANIGTS
ncbi:hypothetical protein P154DRAFT_579609 [Amniculicola lignicola CBS 123094]|uniref:Uncharacterized protein n=1 Tax=Amniculicola lignicola CBS 123094 TaxID=1392246 RepID=A0A6A5W5T9_9PLEO|nr:hypothetical protein P154DRAFT_579609 [Amniculicola lignicola CBS 123094]